MLASLLLALMIQIPVSGHTHGEYGYRVLAPGSYHGYEVKAFDGDVWIGLYEMDSGCYLKMAVLRVEEVSDPYLDREDEQTGRRVSATHCNEESLFLLRPVDTVFQEGDVETALVSSPVLLPDTTLSLGEFGSLFTTAKGLFLTDGETVQRLSDVYTEPYGEHVMVVWAGDLDGDGLADVMLDDQPHYAYNRRLILFLSSESDERTLVREVAEFVAIGC